MKISQRLLAAMLAVAWAAIAGPVAADCEPAGPPAEVMPTAEVAFVGRVVDFRGPAARFAVSEVWAGKVGETVEVRGLVDQADPNAFGEDDRVWEEGVTYLVIPFVDGPVLRDHICTATTEWSDELAALRPFEAQTLRPESTAERADNPVPAILFGLVIAAALAVSVFAFRQHSR